MISPEFVGWDSCSLLVVKVQILPKKKTKKTELYDIKLYSNLIYPYPYPLDGYTKKPCVAWASPQTFSSSHSLTDSKFFELPRRITEILSESKFIKKIIYFALFSLLEV